MDDGVHPTNRVDLIGDGVRLVGAAEITDHHPECALGETANAGRPRRIAGMEDDFVPVVEQSECSRPAQTPVDPLMKTRAMRRCRSRVQ